MFMKMFSNTVTDAVVASGSSTSAPALACTLVCRPRSRPLGESAGSGIRNEGGWCAMPRLFKTVTRSETRRRE
jgi:hypothetical protein